METDSKGNRLGTSYSDKIISLLLDGAVKDDGKNFKDDLVCVVDNGHFAAAAYCFSYQEFIRFNYAKDDRPKTWLIYSHAKTLSGYEK